MNIPLMVLYQSADGAALACAAQLGRLAQAYRIKLPVLDLLDTGVPGSGHRERVLIVTTFADTGDAGADVHGFWNAAAVEQTSNRNGIRFSQLFVGGATAEECRLAGDEYRKPLGGSSQRRAPVVRELAWLDAIL